MNGPENSGAIPSCLNSRYRASLADSMRPIDELAISCFDLGAALPSGFPAVIVPLGLISRLGGFAWSASGALVSAPPEGCRGGFSRLFSVSAFAAADQAAEYTALGQEPRRNQPSRWRRSPTPACSTCRRGLAFPPCGVDDLSREPRPRAVGGQLDHDSMVEVVSSLERDGRLVFRNL
jgi:hypothetical protein